MNKLLKCIPAQPMNKVAWMIEQPKEVDRNHGADKTNRSPYRIGGKAFTVSRPDLVNAL
jgi:hypothetical protein